MRLESSSGGDTGLGLVDLPRREGEPLDAEEAMRASSRGDVERVNEQLQMLLLYHH